MREPEPPRKLNPSVSKEGERIILKLLAKDKTQRYQTATEVRTDLEQLAAPLWLRAYSSGHAWIPDLLRAPAFPVIPVDTGALAITLAVGGYFWWRGHQVSNF